MKKILVLLTLIGCSAEQSQPVQEPKAAVETGPTVEGVWVCEDAKGDAITCETDSDCCSGGFVCIPDRDRGINVKVCIFDPQHIMVR